MRGCVEVRRACVARGGSMASYIARPMLVAQPSAYQACTNAGQRGTVSGSAAAYCRASAPSSHTFIQAAQATTQAA